MKLINILTKFAILFFTTHASVENEAIIESKFMSEETHAGLTFD